MTHIDCSFPGAMPEDCCGFKPGSKRHEVGPPCTTQSPAGGTKQHRQTPAWDLPQTQHKVERQEDAEEQRLVPNPPARPLQWAPLPCVLGIFFYDNKDQELRLSEDFPNGMHPLPVHQSSGSVLVPRKNASY